MNKSQQCVKWEFVCFIWFGYTYYHGALYCTQNILTGCSTIALYNFNWTNWLKHRSWYPPKRDQLAHPMQRDYTDGKRELGQEWKHRQRYAARPGCGIAQNRFLACKTVKILRSEKRTHIFTSHVDKWAIRISTVSCTYPSSMVGQLALGAIPGRCIW